MRVARVPSMTVFGEAVKKTSLLHRYRRVPTGRLSIELRGRQGGPTPRLGEAAFCQPTSGTLGVWFLRRRPQRRWRDQTVKLRCEGNTFLAASNWKSGSADRRRCTGLQWLRRERDPSGSSLGDRYAVSHAHYRLGFGVSSFANLKPIGIYMSKPIRWPCGLTCHRRAQWEIVLRRGVAQSLGGGRDFRTCRGLAGTCHASERNLEEGRW